MVIETSIICVTVLLVVGAVLVFGNKFLTTAKVREEALAAEIKSNICDELAQLKRFKDDVTADIKTIADGHVKLAEQQKTILNAAQMAAQNRTGSAIQTLFDQQNKNRPK
jgi:C4-dicarboxylate-specific signal transduction histidine kinase